MRIRSKSGSADLTIGGVKFTEAIFWSFTLSASSARVATSARGTSVRRMSLLAWERSTNLVAAVIGSSCFAIADITHF